MFRCRIERCSLGGILSAAIGWDACTLSKRNWARNREQADQNSDLCQFAARDAIGLLHLRAPIAHGYFHASVFREVLRFIVTRVRMANNSHPWIRRQDAFDSLR